MSLNEDRGFPPKDFCCGDDDVALGADFGLGLNLFFELLGSEFFCVALIRAAGVTEVDAERLCPEGLGLFEGFGANVKGGHPRAESLRGGDGLETGDTDPEHEDFGGRNRAGRGHHHRKNRVHPVRRDDDSHIAGEVRRELIASIFCANVVRGIISRLIALTFCRANWAMRSFSLKGSRKLMWIAPGFELTDLFVRWLADPGDEIGGAERAGAVRSHGRSGLGVGGIGMIAAATQAGLNDHLGPRPTSFFDGGGIERGSCFDRVGFFGGENIFMAGGRVNMVAGGGAVST